MYEEPIRVFNVRKAGTHRGKEKNEKKKPLDDDENLD
jgi:hypothetical protein